MVLSARVVSLGKYVLALVVLAAVAVSLLPGLREGVVLWPSLNHCKWEWVALAAACQLFVYVCISAIFSGSLVSMGYTVGRARTIYIAFAFLFATRAFAVIGLAVIVLLLGRRQVPADRAHATAGVFYLADYIAFFLLIAILLLGSKTMLQSRAVVTSAVVLILILGGFAAFAYRSPSTAARLVEQVFLWAATTAGHADPELMSRRAGEFVVSLHARWVELTSRREVLAAASLWALLMHFAESATLFCLARAFYTDVPAPAAAAAYVAANLAALVSFLPGGLGIFEGAMAATLHRLGHAPLGPAVVVTLAYRVISVWLPMPVVIGVVREVLVRRAAERRIAAQE